VTKNRIIILILIYFSLNTYSDKRDLQIIQKALRLIVNRVKSLFEKGNYLIFSIVTLYVKQKKLPTTDQNIDKHDLDSHKLSSGYNLPIAPHHHFDNSVTHYGLKKLYKVFIFE
jgi:hypothetical protein